MSSEYDLVNERAVLGACLLDRDAITLIRDILSIEDFSLHKHALIYEAMINLVERRIPPDLVTVAGELRAAGRLDEAGGPTYLGQLIEETPTAVHVEHYATRVAEAAVQRRVIQLGAEIQIRGKAGGDVADLFEEIKVMVDVTRQASTPKANWAASVIRARQLYHQQYEEIPFTVADVLPLGTTLLTGKPKTYKSWLGLNVAMAVASGGKVFSRYAARQGDVLYIDLEMGARRLHKRLHVVAPEADPPRGFEFATSWPPVGAGFETWMRDYVKARPYTRLVVVDTLVGVRGPRKRYEDPYESDKKFTQALSNLCQELRLSMLLIHHSRKADGSDVTDDASGTTGLTGGVDNTMILRLRRHERGMADLYLKGRDIEIDYDPVLRWDRRFAQWNAVEEAPKEKPLTPERRDVLGLLRDRPGLKPKEIALILKRDEAGTRRLLGDMTRDNLVTSAQGGFWFVFEQPAEDDPDDDPEEE